MVKGIDRLCQSTLRENELPHLVLREAAEHHAFDRAPAGLIGMFVAHGTADRVIARPSGRNLFEALPKDVPNQWIDVPGADHDNVLITDFPIYAEIAEWMRRHLPE